MAAFREWASKSPDEAGDPAGTAFGTVSNG